MLNVYAAGEMPAVTDMCIVDTGSGLSAQCSFTGYDAGSDYTIRLYLNEYTAEGNTRIRANKVLERESAGEGIGMTEPMEVTDGIYYVYVSIRNDSPDESTAQYFETEKYDVVKTGSEYRITLRKEKTENRVENDVQGSMPREFDDACKHKYELVLFHEPDADHDAITARQCQICGKVAEYMEVPNSAYAFFQRESADKILAKTEGEVIISTTRWNSFHQMVTDAMMQRPEVRIIVKYRYGGLNETVVIPAGSDRTDLANEDGYCGFLYLKHVFGGSAMETVIK